MFNLIIVSSTCFEQPSFHPQKDLYMQLYGIFHAQIIILFIINYYLLLLFQYKKYYKSASTNLPENEHLVVQNISKTLL
jgi:hypothetical protein